MKTKITCDQCRYHFDSKLITELLDKDENLEPVENGDSTFVCVGCLNDFKQEELKLFMQNFEMAEVL